MDSKTIRQTFLNFFKAKKHLIVPSAPLVLKNDPTLMFTNAGMNQFKDFFLGNAIPLSKRIANTQKCLRVTGKHNDLEDVGHDTYHHTMFEMLGNWSFGDYFKKEALEWSWELLTEVYKLPKDRLYVTVFGGDKDENLEKDTESYEIWKNLIDEKRIILGSKKDNFWEMGDTGPCGPCSEIHIDLRTDLDRKKIPGEAKINKGDPQVIELWNNVFIQYNRKSNGQLEPLPDKHVDTGMGFERLVRVIQNKESNYDTDLFQPLLNQISNLSGIKYKSSEKTDIAMRVVADHIRAIAFAIADGQLPDNNKAGYVIRRILRRAVRYGYTFLGFKEPFLFKLVEILAHQFKDVFPEIYKEKDFVSKVIQEEEQSFLKTLDRGLKILDDYFAHNHKIVDGQTAFLLYDTYGFPLDLTALIVREKNAEVDVQGFEEQMKLQKERSKAASKIETDDWILLHNKIEKAEFIGYDTLTSRSKIVKYRKVKTKNGHVYQIVLDKSPFYPEAGGQVGDKGYLEYENEKILILDSKKENDLPILLVNKLPNHLEAELNAVVDENHRLQASIHHSATHLLHAALKKVLGSHVNQKGSLVSADGMRFDFTHFSKLSVEEIKEIETLVNTKIREAIPLIEKRNVPINEALTLGATALFGEKYGDFVRVITFDPTFSIELCGGTHVKNTAQIGYFKIINETSVAAGVRRIEAVAGYAADAYLEKALQSIEKAKEKLKTSQDLIRSIENLMDEMQKVENQLEKLQKILLNKEKENLKKQILVKSGVHTLIACAEIPNLEALKSLCFEFKNQYDNLFCVLGTVIDEKPMLACIVSENLVSKKGINASQIIKDLAKEIEGGGGGQPFFATAGGKNVNGIPLALEKSKKILESITV
jgi:alanyl-tRNA synthetase